VRLYVGSYADVRVYTADGTPVATNTEVPAPSFLARHPRLPVLYAVSEVAEGTVTALAVELSGALRTLSRRPSGGASPCHLAVTGHHVVCANYGSGTVCAVPVAADGTLGPPADPVTHHGPVSHPHHVSAAGSDLTVVDLGTDTLYGYQISATGTLRPMWTVTAGRGAGPRSLSVHPAGWRFVADELSSTVSAYTPDASGRLRLTATVPATLTPPAQRNYPAEVAVSADGRLVHVANRGNDTITTFAVRADGGLRPVDEVPTGGSWPRHFTIAGPRMYVANQRSGSITVLRLDDGLPRPTGTRIESPDPSCILLV
jgi:6-phosphogluconolactonase (cycloisomerase 2 family)